MTLLLLPLLHLVVLSTSLAQSLPTALGALDVARDEKAVFAALRNLNLADVAWSAVPGMYPISRPLSAETTSPYGLRMHPVRRRLAFHEGLDLRAPLAAPVMATARGVVVRTGYDRRLGNYVYISHLYGFQTRYGHLARVFVRRGMLVGQGQQIALAGATGIVTGPHLHYAVLKNGSMQNPLPYCGLLAWRFSRARRLLGAHAN